MAVRAQSFHKFEVDVPFQFILMGRMLPAGKYVIERLDPTKPNVLSLKNTESGSVRLLIMQRVENRRPSASSSLVFVSKEGMAYLIQVWTKGEMNGSQMSLGTDHQSFLDAKHSTFMRLSAKSFADRP